MLATIKNNQGKSISIIELKNLIYANSEVKLKKKQTNKIKNEIQKTKNKKHN